MWNCGILPCGAIDGLPGMPKKLFSSPSKHLIQFMFSDLFDLSDLSDLSSRPRYASLMSCVQQNLEISRKDTSLRVESRDWSGAIMKRLSLGFHRNILGPGSIDYNRL
jgi:hypothetical protein